MNLDDYIKVETVRVHPLKGSAGLFLCCKEKIILVQPEAIFAEYALMAMQGKRYARPQTHELLSDICFGFGINLQKVLITDLKDEVFFAMLEFKMENEIGTKILQVDARTSDSVLQYLLCSDKVDIFIAPEVFAKAKDARQILESTQSESE